MADLIVGLDIGTTKVCAVVGEMAENGLVDADRCDEIRKRIDIVLDFDEAAREADFAIECVLENMELKQKIKLLHHKKM